MTDKGAAAIQKALDDDKKEKVHNKMALRMARFNIITMSAMPLTVLITIGNVGMQSLKPKQYILLIESIMEMNAGGSNDVDYHVEVL